MLRVLDAVEQGPASVTVDELHARLGYARSTLYRYLKVLTDSGLLASLPELGYMLGPRIIELDYRIRTRDPLIIAGAPVMAELVRAVPGIALLCRRYRHRVLCVHQEQGMTAIRSRYERGRSRPLLRGAASRVILAHLSAATLARLHAADPAAFAEAGLGGTLDAVRQRLRRIRHTGWDATEGQVTPGVTGIAAPVFDNGRSVIGSLSLTLGRTGLDAAETGRIAERVVFCAGIVSNAVTVAPEPIPNSGT